jgi:hypothetical protein
VADRRIVVDDADQSDMRRQIVVCFHRSARAPARRMPCCIRHGRARAALI